jgi:hypothetical protein
MITPTFQWIIYKQRESELTRQADLARIIREAREQSAATRSRNGNSRLASFFSFFRTWMKVSTCTYKTACLSEKSSSCTC